MLGLVTCSSWHNFPEPHAQATQPSAWPFAHQACARVQYSLQQHSAQPP